MIRPYLPSSTIGKKSMKNKDNEEVLIVRNADNENKPSIITDHDASCPYMVAIKEASPDEIKEARNSYADDATYIDFEKNDRVMEETIFISPENSQISSHNCGLLSADEGEIIDRQIDMAFAHTTSYHDWTSEAMSIAEFNEHQEILNPKEIRKMAKEMQKEYGNGNALSWKEECENFLDEFTF